ncbi:hypothetical protein ACFFX1_46760 [Dactylosporangium sucinum]|uniref:Secreted protein n=1 Tax=Dactylosporangium sucinum TaxID=1424081 RepID=A0A917UB72_9ACTN|nr:hypothetical protein [Dactylosporangium sucinum]GGM67799.1 hypothetical protein GCM10007977_081990 [Dactylosporangium sucinum]
MSAGLFDFDQLTDGRVGATATAFAGFDEAQRAVLAGELTAYLKRRRDNWWWGNDASALAVATVGCAPSAAAAAKILARTAVAVPGDALLPVRTVAVARGVTWLPDLAHRIAATFTRDDFNRWPFVAGLLVDAGAAPPTGEHFIRGWLAHLGFPADHRARSRPVLDRLRTNPFLDVLLPAMFEHDDVPAGLLLYEAHHDGRLGLVQALAVLAGEGRLDRAALLDGCVAGLLRGGRPGAQRGLLALHDALAPTTADVTARARDYLRLLADGPAQAAGMAQKALRDADAAEPEALLDASAAVLLRPDKGLVRAQLSWLGRAAARHPGRAAEFGAAIAVACSHDAVDIRERAAALAAKHGAAPAGPAGAAGAVLIGSGDDLPPPAGPAPAPAPITDPDELAEELAALSDWRTPTAPALERVIDAVVRLAGTDRDRVAKSLMPVVERHGRYPGDPGFHASALLFAAVWSAIDQPGQRAHRERWAANLAAIRRGGSAQQVPADSRVPPPQRLLRARLAEAGLYGGGFDGPTARPGGLLAAPTSANGALDPAVLLDRLTALGDDQPWDWDLTQALLRLPPVVDEPLAARAAALRTPGGDRLAAWLRAGGLPAPVLTVADTTRVHPRDVRHDRWAHGDRIKVTLEQAWHPDDRALMLGFHIPSLGASFGDAVLLWPSVLPGYRALVAAYVLPEVAAAADLEQRGSAAVLPLLAECTGDGSPALPVTLAYGLVARHEPDRTAALDALLMLAAGGDLDAPAVGTHLGTLGASSMAPVARAVLPLRDAATAGAPLTVWRILQAALPALLAAPTPPRGTPDLLTLAAETATATAGRGPVAGLADLAARRGSSRLLTEARRLASALSSAG